MPDWIIILMLPLLGLGCAVLLLQLVTSDWLASANWVRPALRLGAILVLGLGVALVVLGVSSGRIVLAAPLVPLALFWLASASEVRPKVRRGGILVLGLGTVLLALTIGPGVIIMAAFFFALRLSRLHLARHTVPTDSELARDGLHDPRKILRPEERRARWWDPSGRDSHWQA
jgi:hypothetical protein